LVHPATEARREQSYWSLRTVGAPESTLQVLVQEILRQLEPHWNEFVELGHKYEAMFGCGCIVRGATGPEMHLESAILSRLVELSASFDIDILCLGEDVE
ncbi:MAG TPA: DUF4279 domain-containing protein, partial [Chloroflexota bacterium]|nr:DUF4279 domain-containing protein [Chloroflexota bacterium]